MAIALSFLLYKSLIGRSERRITERLSRLHSAGTLSETEYNQRLAHKLPTRSKGELVWLHAGTQTALRPAMELYARLAEDRPDIAGLITLGTGVAPPIGSLPDGCTITVAPEEGAGIIRRFMTHWDPDCLIWVGGKFRPALIQAAQERGVECLSIDAAKSTPILEVYQRIPGLRGAVLTSFDHVITANAAATLPWRRAGVDPEQIEALGLLEEGGIAPPYDEMELTRRVTEIGTRPVWFAAQVDEAEIGEVIRAHKRALRRAHRLLLILSLADPATKTNVMAQLEKAGLAVCGLHPDKAISEVAQVILVPHSSGGIWYRTAPVSFLGRSLTPAGGIDPYGAAAMGSAIVHGPYVSDFKAAYDSLSASKAARKVRDGYALGEEIEQLLSPDQAALMAQAAWDIASSGAEVTDRVADLVQDFLDLRERISA
ncbi:3-deoxy-D-manno-octulosonic acid transferase [Celeribacter baekdonensis]|jgi:3-deoxy-D-manno-octulosonic-acid transferase|uniref:3-deoxy-D-manno-octulosonic acid transferase n=1 Tax=Celeribacter baekdonensis TaxID=875171 RepID=A0A2R4M694_9RHOB|nr:glycosyltransferase N-terminal domain-containing protein [Celeribacter baekdonensis]AVW92731.1 3-deoxy-D-manno-octulosonic acid transferase [Celeribacter baekdonensis]